MLVTRICYIHTEASACLRSFSVFGSMLGRSDQQTTTNQLYAQTCLAHLNNQRCLVVRLSVEASFLSSVNFLTGLTMRDFSEGKKVNVYRSSERTGGDEGEEDHCLVVSGEAATF